MIPLLHIRLRLRHRSAVLLATTRLIFWLWDYMAGVRSYVATQTSLLCFVVILTGGPQSTFQVLLMRYVLLLPSPRFQVLIE